ncbi:uncharacterized protein LOC133886898 isoform X2 [Phragmites australis]|uniref:uncharacterized protein LOC133886898 isoform X2 n=1 Tax=Phragmites australis TaxID=29695 RepID=UPI002D775BDA|nr:uncharacterized protein LOC133886898 isoform X2 [Phragmites australis]
MGCVFGTGHEKAERNVQARTSLPRREAAVQHSRTSNSTNGASSSRNENQRETKNTVGASTDSGTSEAMGQKNEVPKEKDTPKEVLTSNLTGDGSSQKKNKGNARKPDGDSTASGTSKPKGQKNDVTARSKAPSPSFTPASKQITSDQAGQTSMLRDVDLDAEQQEKDTQKEVLTSNLTGDGSSQKKNKGKARKPYGDSTASGTSEPKGQKNEVTARSEAPSASFTPASKQITSDLAGQTSMPQDVDLDVEQQEKGTQKEVLISNLTGDGSSQKKNKGKARKPDGDSTTRSELMGDNKKFQAETEASFPRLPDGLKENSLSEVEEEMKNRSSQTSDTNEPPLHAAPQSTPPPAPQGTAPLAPTPAPPTTASACGQTSSRPIPPTDATSLPAASTRSLDAQEAVDLLKTPRIQQTLKAILDLLKGPSDRLLDNAQELRDLIQMICHILPRSKMEVLQAAAQIDYMKTKVEEASARLARRKAQKEDQVLSNAYAAVAKTTQKAKADKMEAKEVVAKRAVDGIKAEIQLREEELRKLKEQLTGAQERSAQATSAFVMQKSMVENAVKSIEAQEVQLTSVPDTDEEDVDIIKSVKRTLDRAADVIIVVIFE